MDGPDNAGADADRCAAPTSLFDDALAANGQIDLVFCNAGVSPPSVPIENLPLDQWQAAIDTNLTGESASSHLGLGTSSSQPAL